MANLLELKVDIVHFREQINRMDVQLGRLNQLREQYNDLLNRMSREVFNDGDEDSVNYEALKNRASEQIRALEAQITLAQVARGTLQKTVDQMEESGTHVASIVENSISTAKNVVDTSVNAAKAAAVAAEVAAIL